MRRPSNAVASVALAVVAALVATGVVLVTREDAPPCPSPTRDELRGVVDAAAGWAARAVQDDGSFWYEYDLTEDRFSRNYFDVRHAGLTMSLYQVVAAGDPSVLPTADAGLRYILDHLTVADDRTAFHDSSSAHLGTTALAVAALVHRRIATDEARYDALMRSMGRFMRSLMRDDGGMWFGASVPLLEPDVGKTSTFYTGESFWAFGLLANLFPGEGWDDDARKVGRYLATERDSEEEIDDPPLADQWAAYGFAEMRTWGDLADDEAAYVRSLVDRYHGRLQREIRREADRVGDGERPPDETVEQSRGAAFGTTVEALGSLWRLSRVDPRVADLEPQLRADLLCGAGILAARQYSPRQASTFERPDVVEGAWIDEGVTRLDDQQHAMSGVLIAIEALAG